MTMIAPTIQSATCGAKMNNATPPLVTHSSGTGLNR